MTGRLALAWAQWATHALPTSASLQQRASMKTAFMCGAAVLLGQVLGAGDDQEQVVRDLGDEVAQFMTILQQRVPGSEETVQ